MGWGGVGWGGVGLSARSNKREHGSSTIDHLLRLADLRRHGRLELRLRALRSRCAFVGSRKRRVLAVRRRAPQRRQQGHALRGVPAHAVARKAGAFPSTNSTAAAAAIAAPAAATAATTAAAAAAATAAAAAATASSATASSASTSSIAAFSTASTASGVYSGQRLRVAGSHTCRKQATRTTLNLTGSDTLRPYR